MVGFSRENGKVHYSEDVIAKIVVYQQWNAME